MTIKQYFKKGGVWNFECDIKYPYRFMNVDICFLNDQKMEDETQFSISASAYSKTELDDLFKDFVKENKIKNPVVLSITVVQVAETMEKLD